MGFLTILPIEFSAELAAILHHLSGTPASLPATDKPSESQSQMVIVRGDNSHLIWRGDEPFVRVRFLDKGHWVDMLVHADPVQAMGFDLHDARHDWQVVEMARCADPLKRRLGQAALVYLIHHRPKDIAIAINQARVSLTLGERQELDRTIASLVRTEVEQGKGESQSRQAFVRCISDPCLRRNLVAASIGTEAPPRPASSTGPTGHKMILEGDSRPGQGASLPVTGEASPVPFLVSAGAPVITPVDSGGGSERPAGHSYERVIPFSSADREALSTARSVRDLEFTPMGHQLAQFVSSLPVMIQPAEGLRGEPPSPEMVRAEMVVALLQGIALLGDRDIGRIPSSTSRESVINRPLIHQDAANQGSQSLRISFQPERQGFELTLQRESTTRPAEGSDLLSERRSFSGNPVALFFARDERRETRDEGDLSVFVPVNPSFFGYAAERVGFLRPTLQTNRADHGPVVNRTTHTEQPDGGGDRHSETSERGFENGSGEEGSREQPSPEEEEGSQEGSQVDNPALQ